MLKFVFCVSAILGGGASSQGTNCDYCKDLYGSPIQLCSDLGLSLCSVRYVYSQTICCSPDAGSDCSDYTSLGSTTFYYYAAVGDYCYGAWKCSGDSSSCPGDVIHGTSYDCLITGPILPHTTYGFQCN
ncbi:MAG: hypothetical protein JXR73_08485 [Candidatus Omnitrophica bacterium]|nr:hypothetical protein [Candidatus Omnitrophota bacterium]